LFLLLVIPAIYRGLLLEFHGVLPGGEIAYGLTPLGYLAFSINYLFLATTLVYLWRHRHERAGHLLAGAIVQTGSLLASLIPALQPYALDSIGLTVSSVLFTQAILREKLFNSLSALNDDLNRTNQQLQITASEAQERETNLYALIENTQDAVWSV